MEKLGELLCQDAFPVGKCENQDWEQPRLFQVTVTPQYTCGLSLGEGQARIVKKHPLVDVKTRMGCMIG